MWICKYEVPSLRGRRSEDAIPSRGRYAEQGYIFIQIGYDFYPHWIQKVFIY